VADENGNYIDVNPAAEQVTGYSRKELLDMNLVDLIAPEMRFEARENFQELKRRGRSQAHDICFIRKDGTRRYWTVNAVKLSDTRFLGFVADTTERKEQEEALVTAKEAAEAADRAKSAFLANMSHELRTPLNPIMGFTDLVLADADLSDEHQSFLRIIKQRSRDLLQLLSDILDIAKVEANRVVIRPEAVDVRELVQDVMAMFKHQATSKGVALNVGISEDFPSCLMVDPARLRQILLNLVGNAVKFTDQGQVAVLVDWREDAPSCPLGTGRLTVEVKDTGCGIKPEMQAHIFESFEQADNSSTRQYGGAGLGLAICKRLAELMGGTIGVKSAPGEGAQFTVTLCTAHEKTDAEEGDLDPAAAKSGSEPEETLRVLLVEDDEASLELTRRMLEREGHVVTCVTTGVEAVEQGLAGDYHLILMDVKLPEMDGLEATQRLREKGCPVPIVAMTAFAFAEDRKACLAAGMNDWISKPLTLDRLDAVIRGLDGLGW
jgi:PAS domain S-box-containing protein